MSARKLLIGIAVASCATICGLLPVGSASAAGLPDGRVYEKVSSLDEHGSDVYQPALSSGENEFLGTPTGLPFQAAADGERVAFVGGPTVGGSEFSGVNGGNEYLATRLGDGNWTETNITPPYVASGIFQAFSNSLTTGFIDAVEPLSPTAPGFGETIPQKGSYDVLYSMNTSGDQYVPLVTNKPPFRTPEAFRTAGSIRHPFFGEGTNGKRGQRILAFAGASDDSRHMLFLANDALTGASEGRPAAEGGSATNFEEYDNLYESVDGQLRLVNILPNGTTHINATFGGGVTGGYKEFSHVISKDGSRVFWTDLTNGHLYVRENGTSTVEISSAGQFQTASSDGSVAFYINGDLYKYELEGAQTTDISPGVPVRDVLAASEDGKYVYYVTTSGAFEVWHDGATATVAAAGATAGEVTPDGHSVVYVSSSPESSQPISVYDADSGLTYCASCTAGGTTGILLKTTNSSVYQSRWISADGSRVFFVSRQALVPQDTNGVVDVYEWERSGAGGCSESAGCVYLLSGATSTQDSYFADASENGRDVFIITRAKLAASDEGELFTVFDARADGTSPVLPPACTGSGCQGIPGAPPIFATPSSVTFEGVGNFAASAKEAKAKPKPKPKAKHKKHKKKKKKSKAKRASRAHGRNRSGAKGGRS